jgi:hypothetical protein
MNSIRRDGRDDTGEQDVRELRHRFAGEPPAPTGMPNDPHLRDKEDVPHEGSLADFYGLEDDGIDAELSALVDAGELCMGWDNETQEVIYWLPEEPKLTERPEQAPKPHSRRARKPRKRSNIYRRTVLTLVASIAPLFVGMAAEASLDMHADRTRPMDQPDMAGADVPAPTPAPSTSVQDAVDTASVSGYRPNGSSYENAAKHARVTTSPTVEKPESYVGKHRKALGKHITVRPKASRKTESKTPRPSPAVTSKPPVTSDAPSRQDPNTPAEIVVHGILDPVASLLK